MFFRERKKVIFILSQSYRVQRDQQDSMFIRGFNWDNGYNINIEL